MIREFLMFGLIEVFVLLMFYKYVGKINSIKFWHGFVIAILFFLFGLINFPFIKQISMIVIMMTYLFLINKTINIKVVFIGFMYLLIIEAIFCISYEFIFKLDITKVDIYLKFLMLIPIRLFEICLILLYKRSIKHGMDMVFTDRQSRRKRNN